MIDLRSDTVTQPTPAMLKAMMAAPVGDDVFGEDPTINELQERTAQYLGHEAGLFVPSGTMANQIAIKVHTRPGDEVICHHTAHIYNYEGGGVAFNSGCQVRSVGGERGLIDFNGLAEALQPTDVHKCPSRLLVAENTANKGGGSCYSVETLQQMQAWSQQHGLHFHLDGARLWNALVAKNQNPQEIGALFNSVSVCFSKGLGCPVGSVLVGSQGFIDEARYIRKKMGGGMRQAGYLAAAAIYALDNHVERLAQDHARASRLEEALQNCNLVARVNPVETNIVIFHTHTEADARHFMKEMETAGVKMVAMGTTTLRFVTHLNLSDGNIDAVIKALRQID